MGRRQVRFVDTELDVVVAERRILGYVERAGGGSGLVESDVLGMHLAQNPVVDRQANGSHRGPWQREAVGGREPQDVFHGNRVPRLQQGAIDDGVRLERKVVLLSKLRSRPRIAG